MGFNSGFKGLNLSERLLKRLFVEIYAASSVGFDTALLNAKFKGFLSLFYVFSTSNVTTFPLWLLFYDTFL